MRNAELDEAQAGFKIAGKNLLCYAVLLYFAARSLKAGKLLLCALGMIPTSVFMASCYSYDWWIIGWVFLAYSKFFSYFQDSDKKLSTKDMLLMTVFMMLGCLPKPTYFPLFIPFLFLPARCFTGGGQKAVMRILAVGMAAALIASFALPMLFPGDGPQKVDTRLLGGIDQMGQIRYILSRPFEYAGILGDCIKKFLFPEGANEYLEHMAYMGRGDHYVVDMIVIAILTFIDKTKEHSYNIGRRVLVILMAFLSLILAMTAMYIATTPLMGKEIIGYQGRYILPVLLPVLYSVFSAEERPKINFNAVSVATFVWMTLSFLLCVWYFCIQWF